jgi:predicted Rossmann-fold nucleotide-binding protein
VARAFMHRLQDAGFTIAYDWTSHREPELADLQGRARIAENDLQGVTAADAVVVILPGGFGTHTEMGFALGQHKPVVLIAVEEILLEGPHPIPFYYAPGVIRFIGPEAEDQAFRYLQHFRQAEADGEERSMEVWG